MGKQYTVRCKELTLDGKGVVSFNNSTFEVPGVLPGEKCTIELVYGKDKTTAKLIDIVKEEKVSKNTAKMAEYERTDVICPMFLTCGACSLLHMKYESEVKFKYNKVKELFKDFDVPVFPVICADDPLNYRNKVYASFGYEFSKKKGRQITAGMYEEETRRVVNCKSCQIQNKHANEIIKSIVSIMEETGTRSYDKNTKTGTLRHVYIRVAKKTGKTMVVLVTGTPEFKEKSFFVEKLTKKHREITTIIHNINTSPSGMILGSKSKVLYGEGFIVDELLGCKFKISEKSFYQVNPAQTEKLYQTAIQFANLTKTDVLLDAYCGIGTIGICAAKDVRKVVGVENNCDAISDAKENLKINSSTNVEFFEDDAADFLEKNLQNDDEKLNPNVIILDPPRSGSTEKFLKAACNSGADRIVYVSCNPETQVRDIKFMQQFGFEPVKVQPVDLFPRTTHVETVCLLINQNAKAKHHVNVGIDAEDYYKIKEGK